MKFFGKDAAPMVDSAAVRKLVELSRDTRDQRVRAALLWLRSGTGPSLF